MKTVFNVYQVQVKCWDWKINKILPKEQRKAYFRKIGIVEVREGITTLNKETDWHLTNWRCWGADKNNIESEGYRYIPNRNDQGVTNSDMCFEFNDVWFCADSSGWTTCYSKEEAKKHLLNNYWVKSQLKSE